MISPRDGAVVEGRNLALAYGATRALRGASISIHRGELHALVGNHGEGKSSLCRILGGLAEPDAGEIRVESHARRALNLELAAQLGIEFVDKSARLFNDLSVAENIAMAECRRFRPFWHRPGGNRAQVGKWLSRFDIPFPIDTPLSLIHPEEHNFVQMLSRLYTGPKLLILDETLEFLPSSLFAMSLDILKKHVANGMSLLWVTHQLDNAVKHAHVVSVLRYGEVVSTEKAAGMDKRRLIRRAYLDVPGESEMGGYHEFLQATEAVLRDLPLAIVLVNRYGRLQYLNGEGERLFPGGATADLGDDVSVLLGGENEQLLSVVSRAIASAAMIKPQTLSLSSPGGKCLVSAQACQIRDNGELVGAMLVVQDVSEQEGMREKLMLDHNLASIGMLAAGVAHEVNNPLEVLGNYLRYLKNNPRTPRAMDLFSEMQEEVANIQKIIMNLMSFSGRTSENRKSVDIFPLASELSSLINLEAGAENIRIVCHGPGQPALIHADAGEIRQILLNLIRNSIEAMPDGGEIVIDVLTDEERVWLTFRDNGGGIGFESLNDIFLPFASTKSATGKNHGLGLSIVRNLVDKHGGVISVDNLATGCEFVISFPAL